VDDHDCGGFAFAGFVLRALRIFATNALGMGSVFRIAWGIATMGVVFGIPNGGTPWWIALASAGLAGGLFGSLMARYYRREATRSGLPSWDDYPEA